MVTKQFVGVKLLQFYELSISLHHVPIPPYPAWIIANIIVSYSRFVMVQITVNKHVEIMWLDQIHFWINIEIERTTEFLSLKCWTIQRQVLYSSEFAKCPHLIFKWIHLLDHFSQCSSSIVLVIYSTFSQRLILFYEISCYNVSLDWHFPNPIHRFLSLLGVSYSIILSLQKLPTICLLTC